MMEEDDILLVRDKLNAWLIPKREMPRVSSMGDYRPSRSYLPIRVRLIRSA